MKAIYIPYNFDIVNELEKLNKELKDATKIEFDIDVNQDQQWLSGRLLIISNHNRKDKLKKLNKISKDEKGTNNNSI